MNMNNTQNIPTVEEVAAKQHLFSQLHGADWRAPIDTWIRLVQFDAYADACMFFTATELKPTGERKVDRGFSMIRVKAIGYRAGPAGP